MLASKVEQPLERRSENVQEPRTCSTIFTGFGLSIPSWWKRDLQVQKRQTKRKTKRKSKKDKG